jgi:hypothetical protein
MTLQEFAKSEQGRRTFIEALALALGMARETAMQKAEKLLSEPD